MSEIKIQRASPEDAKEILSLLKVIGSESDKLSFGREGLPVTEKEEYEFLSRIEHSDREAFFVARKASEIIGTAHYTAFSKKRMVHRHWTGSSKV